MENFKIASKNFQGDFNIIHYETLEKSLITQIRYSLFVKIKKKISKYLQIVHLTQFYLCDKQYNRFDASKLFQRSCLDD